MTLTTIKYPHLGRRSIFRYLSSRQLVSAKQHHLNLTLFLQNFQTSPFQSFPLKAASFGIIYKAAHGQAPRAKGFILFRLVTTVTLNLTHVICLLIYSLSPFHPLKFLISSEDKIILLIL